MNKHTYSHTHRQQDKERRSNSRWWRDTWQQVRVSSTQEEEEGDDECSSSCTSSTGPLSETHIDYHTTAAAATIMIAATTTPHQAFPQGSSKTEEEGDEQNPTMAFATANLPPSIPLPVRHFFEPCTPFHISTTPCHIYTYGGALRF